MESRGKTILVATIDKVIAAGGSTLLGRLETSGVLEEGLTEVVKKYRPDSVARAICVQESVDAWLEDGSLAEFCEDPKNKAFWFQCHAFHSRIKSVREASREAAVAGDDADVVLVLTERSLYGDYCFGRIQEELGNFSPKQAATYKSMWLEWSRLIWTPDVLFFLDTPPDEAIKRQISRAREGESYSESYQKLLYDVHAEMFARNGSALVKLPDGLVRPCYRLDGMAAFHNDSEELARIGRTMVDALAVVLEHRLSL